jgi:tetratricopeptide (TPR) repeat protein
VWDNFESALPQYQQAGGAGAFGALGALGLDDAGRARLHAFYRDLTAGKAEKIEGRLLVTCRPEATGLAGIKEIALGGLARPDSLHLLTAIADVKGINLERPGCEPHEIAHLLTALQDYPLSISLVTPHLKALTPAEIRHDFASHLDRFTDDTAEEGRNRSLRASLAFSASRLSEPARAVLPWLAWFQGGAFENRIRNFTGLEADAWAAVRQELEATALVRVEELKRFTTPFLRFHPTLPYAARSEDVPSVDAAEQRFLGVYLAVAQEADDALQGRTAAAGMALMAREEANFRSAIDRAFQRGERQQGWALADTLQTYLQMAARPRERDALAAWVRDQMPDDAGLDAATCAATRQHAWGLFGQGQAGEAIAALQQLIRRLETEGLAGGEDATFQIGTSYAQMGQILVDARRTDLALEPCRKAIEHLERAPGEAARGNLSAALGVLANTLRRLGRLPEALETAERVLAINLEMGRDRSTAAGHGLSAEILSSQGRYGEAEARYQEAQRLAEQVGDLELQGTFLQHRGFLNREQGQHDQAVELYRDAIRLFQRANDQASEMQTYNLLATAEVQRGQLDAAEAWYDRSRVLAQELGDQAQMAATAQNLGILFQNRAEQTEDSETREALLRRAVASVEESLAIWLKREDRVRAASSDFQLGVLHRMLGDLDRAEVHLLKGLETFESLDLPNVWKVYGNLADVSEARGDSEAAAAWQAKCDAKRAELERLRG